MDLDARVGFLTLYNSIFKFLGLRDMETNNYPILLAFQLVFFVVSKRTYFNMLPLTRLEYELKFCAIFV